MLIIIPVCKKDESLVVKNLDWISELDGKIEAKAILSVPRGFVWTAIDERAKAIFSDVGGLEYDEWGGDANWPHPQNWAWQSTARMLSGYSPQPWLWWEADATPVAKAWYDVIKCEYERVQKPFMGCIVEANGAPHHMTGVGVYPANTPSYSTNAMLCRAAPFDIALWPDIHQHVHKANHIIQHHVRENGDSTHFIDQASVESIVQPGVVLFHRCKDGSLIDRLRGIPPIEQKIPKRAAKPFLKRLAGLVPQRPKWRSILKQTKWEAGFFDLPSHKSECHFNCAIIEDKDNVLWLVSRRWRKTSVFPWQSDLVRHRLTADLNITERQPILLPKQTGAMEQHEDPRIIRRGTGFSIGYCSWLMGAKFQAHQVLAALDANWNCVSTFHLLYGNNGGAPGYGIGHEKNWIWFYHDQKLFMVYRFAPHIVVEASGETQTKEHKTETPLAELWKHGQIRGGTPPVRIGDEYVSFFHSSMPWRPRQNRYFMGAYSFAKTPPFQVTRITPKPLLVGSEEDPRSLGGPLVVFSCGALIKNDEWLVTLGVNDQSCAWIKIPIDDLEKKLCSTLPI